MSNTLYRVMYAVLCSHIGTKLTSKRPTPSGEHTLTDFAQVGLHTVNLKKINKNTEKHDQDRGIKITMLVQIMSENVCKLNE